MSHYAGRSGRTYHSSRTGYKRPHNILEIFERRTILVEALNRSLDIFISHREKNFDDVMTNGIWPIAEVLGLDRVTVYRLVAENGNEHLEQMYDWDGAEGGITPVIDNENILPHIRAIPQWSEILWLGGAINTCASLMSEEELEFKPAKGAKSLMIVPIFTHDEMWGLCLFQDYDNDKLFDENGADLLSSAARICVNAIIREDKTRSANEALQALTRREKMVDMLNKTAIMFLSHSEEGFEEMMTEGVKLIVDMIGLDRLSVWRNFKTMDSSRVSQSYCWDRGSGGTTAPTEDQESYMYSQIAPKWEALLALGHTINSPVKLLPEAAMLKPMGIVSVFVAPVFINYKFWGFVLFEDRHSERFFEDAYAEIMRSAAFLYANTVIRAEMEHEIKQALHQANLASKAKGDFLSNMSHEMRTPLNAIIGMTVIGKNATTIDRKDYSLSKIEDASTHLLGVINDVLDMSKIEANKLELSPIEFNFEKMLQNVMTVTNFRVDEKKQKFSLHLDGRLPRFVVADDQRLSQVIINLLSNAVKFTPQEGDISLAVYLVEEEGDACTLRIEVEDTGIGLSVEQQAKLFKTFTQAESGTSRQFGGTGLGLAISKSIVELMGGEIWIESELGRGAKFIFTVKVQRGNKNIRSLLDPSISWETVRILVVDDAQEVCEHIQGLFNRLGVKCDKVYNGLEACQLLEQNGQYDLYFIDWRMPGMDGIELTKYIRGKEVGKSNYPAVVTMITSADWALIKDDALAAGVDNYLLKPLFSSMIIDSVNKCLGIDIAVQGTNELDDEGLGEFAGKHLLIAEDVDINREILITLLEGTGLVIDCAENGQEALDMVLGAMDKYDLVFMDVQMPKMDGLEATRQIRAALQRDGKLPIVAMTANVFKDDIKECLNAGMDDHIGKPIDMEEVLNKLRQHLQ